MFWGLIMEPNKRYTQVVQRSFHISMAALDCTSEKNDNVQVLVGINEKNFLLCNLNPKNLLQTQLDLNFQSGDKIAFMHSGTGYVHLTGYLVPEDDFDEMLDEAEEEAPELVKPNKKALKRKSNDNEEIKTKKKKLPTADLLEALANESDDDNDDSFVIETLDEESEESEDSDDDDENEDGDDNENEEVEGEDEDEESDDDDESDESSEDESEESEDEDAEETIVEKKPSKKDKKQKVQNGTVSPKKNKKQTETSPNKGTEESPKSKKAEKQQKKDKSKKKADKNDKENTKNNDKDKDSKPLKKTVEGGVHIEDLKVGNGPVAKPGKFVQVYYEGRLKSTGKQFDASKTGPGFKFRLGKKEVIQGWDIGVAGMRVGGKRRITCPPQMAYGAKGSPPVIPPNSTLVFEVELRNVN